MGEENLQDVEFPDISFEGSETEASPIMSKPALRTFDDEDGSWSGQSKDKILLQNFSDSVAAETGDLLKLMTPHIPQNELLINFTPPKTAAFARTDRDRNSVNNSGSNVLGSKVFQMLGNSDDNILDEEPPPFNDEDENDDDLELDDSFVPLKSGFHLDGATPVKTSLPKQTNVSSELSGGSIDETYRKLQMYKAKLASLKSTVS